MMRDGSAQRVLHIAPGDSACGSLRLALQSAGRDEDVLPFLDDLSCGPIDPDEPDLRETWWNFETDGCIRDSIRSFWSSVEASVARIIVWYGRHSAREANFFLHWVHRVGERPFEVMDVTGLQLDYIDRHGRNAVTAPLQAVGTTPTEALPSLFGTERALTIDGRARARDDWRRLMAENASFRVVTGDGLISAPIEHFDGSLLQGTSREWRKSARVVGDCLARNWKPYIQVCDMLLARRLEALVEAGALEARGDICDLRASEVRLPG